MTNDLLRYNNAVNNMDLFNSILKFSFRGVQSMGEQSGMVAARYRNIHPSYIGRVSLTSSSAGDPGLTGLFTPFCKTNKFHFTEKNLDE